MNAVFHLIVFGLFFSFKYLCLNCSPSAPPLQKFRHYSTLKNEKHIYHFSRQGAFFFFFYQGFYCETHRKMSRKPQTVYKIYIRIQIHLPWQLVTIWCPLFSHHRERAAILHVKSGKKREALIFRESSEMWGICSGQTGMRQMDVRLGDRWLYDLFIKSF